MSKYNEFFGLNQDRVDKLSEATFWIAKRMDQVGSTGFTGSQAELVGHIADAILHFDLDYKEGLHLAFAFGFHAKKEV